MYHTRMIPGLLTVISALAAAAGSSATEPSAFVCPGINATLSCACSGSRVTCNGLHASNLSFLAPSVSAIRALFASHNDLRELAADFLQDPTWNTLKNATNLQELTLSYNKIASIDGRVFKHLPSLVILDLSHNNLVEFYLPQDGLPKLEILNLTNNCLSRLRFDADRPEKKLENINRNNVCGFPARVFSGKGLEQLYLSHNKIGNDLSFSRNLTELKILTLGFNNISKIEPTFFPCDETLRCLHLNNNLLRDLKFLKCTEFLDQLNLSSNAISAIPENSFTDLSLLRSLDIADNGIENPKFLLNVGQSITFLNLSRNKLSSIPANSMITMSTLKYVDVSHNELSDISFAGSIKNIEEILAGNNKISRIDETVFFKFRSNVIKHLSLRNNLLSNIDFLKQLQNITRLDLNNNTINQIKDDTMSRLKKLEALDLSNNRISNVHFVSEVPFLRFLKLSNNNVTHLPCSKVVQTIYLDGNDVRNLQISCAPNLRHLHMHGGIFKDGKEQELRISKEVDLGINNHTITFPCFPTLELILKCKKHCSQTDADNMLCGSHGTFFSDPIAIVIYCISALMFSLLIVLFVAKCYRQRKRRGDNNRECLCAKDRVRRHQTFRDELCW